MIIDSETLTEMARCLRIASEESGAFIERFQIWQGQHPRYSSDENVRALFAHLMAVSDAIAYAAGAAGVTFEENLRRDREPGRAH